MIFFEYFGGFTFGLLALIFVISIIVFVHEFGHYIVGRWCKIHAEVFSVGMGPSIWSVTDRRGTIWQISALPLGGYVRFLGDADASSRHDYAKFDALSQGDKTRSFSGAALWRRALTVIAGPAANFLFSIVIFAGFAFFDGIPAKKPIIDDFVKGIDPIDLKSGDLIKEINGVTLEDIEKFENPDEFNETFPAEPLEYLVLRDGAEIRVKGPMLFPSVVTFVQPISPAASAGVEVGDLIIEFAGQAVSDWEMLGDVIRAHGDRRVEMKVMREGAEITLWIKPQELINQRLDGTFEKRVMIGVGGAQAYNFKRDRPGIGEALRIGFWDTWGLIVRTIDALRAMFAGQVDFSELQGPVGIAQVSAHYAEQGLSDLIFWVAAISTAIGFFNLLPIPVLDGGHLMLFGYEAIARKRPSKTIVQGIMYSGLALLLSMTLFVTYNDVLRLLNYLQIL